MPLSDAQISTGATEILTMIDQGQGNQAVDRLRSDAFEMKPEDFLKLVKQIQEKVHDHKGADLEIVDHSDGKKTICIKDEKNRTDSAVASVKDGKIVDTFLDCVPDKIRGQVIEQSDVPKLPKLTDEQKKVYEQFDLAILNGNPVKVAELVQSFRGKAQELEPIMECLAADLAKHGIGLQYNSTKFGLSGKDITDTGNLELFDKNGGPVIYMLGYPGCTPIIDRDLQKGPDGNLTSSQRKIDFSVHHPGDMPLQVQKVFSTWADRIAAGH